jgi:hypothetical protein
LPAFETADKPQTKILYNGVVMAGDKLVISSARGELLFVSPLDGKIEKTFDIGNLADVSKSALQERQQNLPRIQPPIQRAEIAQTVDLGQDLEEAVEQQKNETIQKTFLSTAEERPVGQPIPWEEKYGVKTFFTKSAGDITSLLQQRICNVEFTRTTSPQGKRVLRCTLNPDYIPSRTSGLGNYGGLIKVWDVELNDYRSFYSTSVHKISYDENPGRRG